RQLVPMFLSWATAADQTDEPMPEGFLGEPPSLPVMSPGKWTRKDQKALLNLFALFTNPKVLFRSSEVYTALLGLLSNGDIEMQKLALKAIFTWKSPSIRPYEENLLNLLDEARFNEEIAI